MKKTFLTLIIFLLAACSSVATSVPTATQISDQPRVDDSSTQAISNELSVRAV